MYPGQKKIGDKISCENLSKKLDMMSVNQMTCYHYLVECFNIINFGSSEKLRKKLMPKNPRSKSLTVPLVRKNNCRGFAYYAAKLWNSMPAKIRIGAMNLDDKKNQKSRLESFKRSVKLWILGNGVPFQ